MLAAQTLRTRNLEGSEKLCDRPQVTAAELHRKKLCGVPRYLSTDQGKELRYCEQNWLDFEPPVGSFLSFANSCSLPWHNKSQYTQSNMWGGSCDVFDVLQLTESYSDPKMGHKRVRINPLMKGAIINPSIFYTRFCLTASLYTNNNRSENKQAGRQEFYILEY